MTRKNALIQDVPSMINKRKRISFLNMTKTWKGPVSKMNKKIVTINTNITALVQITLFQKELKLT